MSGINRRSLMKAGAFALAAPSLIGRAMAEAPGLVASAGLSGRTGYIVADLQTGEVLEAQDADGLHPPASVAKVVTTLYSLDALGTGHRFVTRVRAAGPIDGGVLHGDLVLEGGGDPTLDTDGLTRLVAALRTAGLVRVEGRFLVADGALPAVARVAGDQPEDAGYDPSIGGLNVDFNRALVRWAPKGEAGTQLSFLAPGERTSVPLTGITGRVAPGPIRHTVEDGREVWSLPPARVPGRGEDWFPVRLPAQHGAEVFRGLAGQAGLTLPAGEVVSAASGAEMAQEASPDLADVLRGMLQYSTNLTAEVVGLRASQARGLAPIDLATSAASMSGWAQARFGREDLALVDHSGLGGASRVSPAALVAALRNGAAAGLPGLLHTKPIAGPEGSKNADFSATLGVSVVAKTGTLWFASGLAGYMTGGRTLLFAIFSSDAALRLTIDPAVWVGPPGAKRWTGQARGLQQALLRRWAVAYAQPLRTVEPLRPRARL